VPYKVFFWPYKAPEDLECISTLLKIAISNLLQLRYFHFKLIGKSRYGRRYGRGSPRLSWPILPEYPKNNLRK
jgi:hypothetical protein